MRALSSVLVLVALAASPAVALHCVDGPGDDSAPHAHHGHHADAPTSPVPEDGGGAHGEAPCPMLMTCGSPALPFSGDAEPRPGLYGPETPSLRSSGAGSADLAHDPPPPRIA